MPSPAAEAPLEVDAGDPAPGQLGERPSGAAESAADRPGGTVPGGDRTQPCRRMAKGRGRANTARTAIAPLDHCDGRSSEPGHVRTPVELGLPALLGRRGVFDDQGCAIQSVEYLDTGRGEARRVRGERGRLGWECPSQMPRRGRGAASGGSPPDSRRGGEVANSEWVTSTTTGTPSARAVPRTSASRAPASPPNTSQCSTATRWHVVSASANASPSNNPRGAVAT